MLQLTVRHLTVLAVVNLTIIFSVCVIHLAAIHLVIVVLLAVTVSRKTATVLRAVAVRLGILPSTLINIKVPLLAATHVHQIDVTHATGKAIVPRVTVHLIRIVLRILLRIARLVLPSVVIANHRHILLARHLPSASAIPRLRTEAGIRPRQAETVRPSMQSPHTRSTKRP
ncbi:hypothetical protein Aduo_008901 [Ancylostoma duodenale]